MQYEAAGNPGVYRKYQAEPGAKLVDPYANSGDRTYAIFLHLTLLISQITLPIVPVLVMWLIKKDQSPFLDDHGKESLNFQIALLLYTIGFVIVGILTLGLGLLLLIPLWILGMVCMVLAAVAASRGEYYRYPACLRLVH